VNALLHLLQHPNLRFGINALLVDTLLGGLPKPLDTHERLKSRPRTSGSNFNSSRKQSILSEIYEDSTPIGQLVRPAAFEPQFKSRFGLSFAEIAKNEKTKRSKDCFAELILQPNGPSFASQKCTEGEKLSLLNARLQR
jgi:hypothetical protein